MKCRIVVAAILLLLLAAGLGRDAIVPDRFTGIWYAAGTGEAYHFREGIIQKSDAEGTDGAYAFTGKTITLFVTNLETVSSVTDLYWIPNVDGDLLCTDAMGKQVVFMRKP